MISTRRLTTGVVSVGAALALLLAGCGSTTDNGGDHASAADHESASDQHATSPQADGAAAHNAADVSFASGMIPHHEQAVAMSDILLAKQGIDPRVVELANQIKAAQGPEIATMQQWLTEWKAPAASHEGHDMGAMGMMTEQQLEQLRQAQGADATRQFLAGMIAHHQGAVEMAQTEVDSGQADAAVHLAHEINESQQREIDTMKQILGSM